MNMAAMATIIVSRTTPSSAVADPSVAEGQRVPSQGLKRILTAPSDFCWNIW